MSSRAITNGLFRMSVRRAVTLGFRPTTASVIRAPLCRFYSATAKDGPVLEAIGRAIAACKFDTPPSGNEVAMWIAKLKDDEGVVNCSDLDQGEAADILRRVGIKNAKLRNAILRDIFPAPEPKPAPAAPEPAAPKEEDGSSTTSSQSDVDAEDEKWRKVAEDIAKLREEKRWKELVPFLQKMINQAEEKADQLHPFYIPSLFQEMAQAYYQQDNYELAMDANASAMAIYTMGDNDHKVMEGLEFQGVLLEAMGQYEAAAMSFTKIIEWAEGPGKEGSPVQSCAAKDLLRTSQSFYGDVLVSLGDYAKAEELLSACLAPNAEANDFHATLRTLKALMRLFKATKDEKRFASTGDRALVWCDKFRRPDVKAEIQAFIEGKELKPQEDD